MVSGVFDWVLEEDPEHEALVSRHERLTYYELENRVNSAASVLCSMGVQRGERVAASMSNRSELVVAFLATLRLGGIWVGINPVLALPEIEYQLADSGARVFIAEDHLAAGLGGSQQNLDGLRQVIAVERNGGRGEWAHLMDDAGADEGRRVQLDPQAPAAIAYTSGTTGRPKGVVHSQYNLMVVATGAGGREVPGREDRVGICLPLTLLNLMVLGPLSALAAGGVCVALDSVEPTRLAKWIFDEGITLMPLVPTILYDLFKQPDLDLSSMSDFFRPSVGGGDFPPAWRHMFASRGLDVRQTYGLTEAPTTVTKPDPNQPEGSCGRPLPHIRVSIVEQCADDGPGPDRVLGPGEVGEICIGPVDNGPYAGLYKTMLGYWNQPEATAKTLRGGLVHTGDLGMVDESGFLYLTGRRHDVIVRGGANIYPAEVERVLLGDPGVRACAVVGVPDERLGQRVVAAVEQHPGKSFSEDDLRAQCARELARYKVPERIFLLRALPRTQMGKVRRSEVLSTLMETSLWPTMSSLVLSAPSDEPEERKKTRRDLDRS